MRNKVKGHATMYSAAATKALRIVERAILGVIYDQCGEREWCLHLAPICEATGLSREIVAAVLKGTTDKGLSCYSCGLFTEDGEPAGAGYGITQLGIEAVVLRDVEPIE
jgi:hypothetical protein